MDSGTLLRIVAFFDAGAEAVPVTKLVDPKHPSAKEEAENHGNWCVHIA